MILSMTSAAMAVAVLLVLWLIPLSAFLLSTTMRGIERFNWAMLVAMLSWPAFALYLFYSGIKRRQN